ncbi:MAG: bifunctional phosphoribosylaminoimidazolecarboxamide formyltransferase/IMP cyclohydrolase [Nocardioidaceae bacterium]
MSGQVLSGTEQPAAKDGRRPVKRALISVFDKQRLEELAGALAAHGVAMVSTGSTADRIQAAGHAVTRVEELTGFRECLDGRVKTLHPSLHAGLLADQRLESHRQQLAELGIEPFDLVVSNLYPFTDTVLSGASRDECIEQIDIGGPAMVRSSAKNHPSVAVVTSPAQYDDVLAALSAGGFSLAQRQRLAAEAFVHTATYDLHVASWMGNVVADTSESTGFPAWAGATWTKADVLRYGENPHQRAALYVDGFVPTPGLAQAEQLHGKQMSYNNYVDADAACRAAFDFGLPAVAIIKHANPCGLATGTDIAEAHRKAHACDPLSAFGGVIATNRAVSAEMARQIADIFTEVVVAPDYEVGAVEALQAKKSIRVLRAAGLGGRAVETRSISGGMLMQSVDTLDAEGDRRESWTLAAGVPLEEGTLDDLEFAWRSCRAVKSNAIVLGSGGATVGIGMGQVNRLDSARLAVERAGDRAAGSVAASDAFFPFADGLNILIDAGVRAVIQPGGSVRDAEVVAAAEAAGMTMYFTGARHFSS